MGFQNKTAFAQSPPPSFCSTGERIFRNVLLSAAMHNPAGRILDFLIRRRWRHSSTVHTAVGSGRSLGSSLASALDLTPVNISVSQGCWFHPREILQIFSVISLPLLPHTAPQTPLVVSYVVFILVPRAIEYFTATLSL